MTEKTTKTVSPEKSAEYLRLSLGKLGELGLPVTAQNYALFYVYHSGRSEELNRRMDEVIADNATFTDAIINDLFSKYVCECSGIDLEELNRELLQAVAQILGALVDFAGQAAISNQSLEGHLEKMSKTNDPAEILREAAGIIADTRSFIDNTQVLEEAMQEVQRQAARCNPDC